MKKILVVEDSTFQRKTIIQHIRNAGFAHEIVEAADGLEGLALVGEMAPEIGLVLCDWNMPNMDGLEFIQSVAEVPAVRKIPIVMVTTEGSSEKFHQAKAANSNLVGYVVKPFTPEQLREAIAWILASDFA